MQTETDKEKRAKTGDRQLDEQTNRKTNTAKRELITITHTHKRGQRESERQITEKGNGRGRDKTPLGGSKERSKANNYK